MANVEELLESISQLTVLELSELVKAAEEKFGVSAAAPMAMAAAPAAGGDGGGDDDGPSAYNVILAEVGQEKIKVIKEVRGITGLGLKEAKELVDGAPSAIKEGVEEAEAKAVQEQLKAVGATVELKGV